jgi:hypothetical protein
VIRAFKIPGYAFGTVFALAGIATAFAGALPQAALAFLTAAGWYLIAWWATPADACHPSTTDRYPAVSVEP